MTVLILSGCLNSDGVSATLVTGHTVYIPKGFTTSEKSTGLENLINLPPRTSGEDRVGISRLLGKVLTNKNLIN